MEHDFDVVVLGGGAAGLMCAIEAGRRGTRVAVVERKTVLGGICINLAVQLYEFVLYG